MGIAAVYAAIGFLFAAAKLPLVRPWHRILGRITIWLVLWPLFALVMLTRRRPQT